MANQRKSPMRVENYEPGIKNGWIAHKKIIFPQIIKTIGVKYNNFDLLLFYFILNSDHEPNT